jgi:hypothetical protein
MAGRFRLPGWLRWLVTFHLVVFGWILFRSPSLDEFGTFLSRFTVSGPASLWTATAVAAIIVVIGTQLLPPDPLERVQTWIERRSPALLGAGLAIVIALAGATVSGQGVPPFIYFRF